MELRMPSREEIGKRLRVLRGSKTLETVGKDLNVSAMAVSLWERGERIPNDEMKVKIAVYYNTTVNGLFFA